MFAREAAFVLPTLLRQYAGPAAIRDRQLRELQTMLEAARSTVPFYRQPAYRRDRLKSLADFAELPVISKRELRSEPASFLAEGIDLAACTRYATSGTTGQRVEVLHDARCHDYHNAACFRRLMASGRYRPTARLIHIMPRTPPKRFFERFGLFRRKPISSELPAQEIIGAMLAERPHVIISYPIYLRHLARSLTPEQSRRIRRKLRAIFTESELLIDTHRRMIEDAFGVPVFDEYSAFETLNIYFECAHHRCHIAEDRVLVEVVDEAGAPVPDGTAGEVVVTSFLERAMPLIRYSLGDVGLIEPDPCPCGRSFRTMRLTAGRSEDYVVLPDRSRLYCSAFLLLVSVTPEIDECYVEQDETGTIRFFYVPSRTAAVPASVLEQRFRAAILEKVRQPVPLEIVRAEAPRITAGGKGKFVTSRYRPAA